MTQLISADNLSNYFDYFLQWIIRLSVIAVVIQKYDLMKQTSYINKGHSNYLSQVILFTLIKSCSRANKWRCLTHWRVSLYTAFIKFLILQKALQSLDRYAGLNNKQAFCVISLCHHPRARTCGTAHIQTNTESWSYLFSLLGVLHVSSSNNYWTPVIRALRLANSTHYVNIR